MMLSLVSSVVFLCIVGSTIGLDCTTLPTNAELEEALNVRIDSDLAGEGADATITNIGGPYYSCQAQGTSKDTYRELSVIMTYTATVGGVATDSVKQFELDCVLVGADNTWTGRADSLSDIPVGLDYTSIAAMTACSSCGINPTDNDHHCQACDATCITGLMSCTGTTAADCCVAFDDDGSCLTTTTSCTKAGYVSTLATNWECECGQVCGAGTEPNSACDGCDVTNICLANNPCLNGGDCTLNAPPDTYMCTCTNSYIGPTCSVCNHTCHAGYAVSADCDDCDLTSICEANEPCMNGGTCSLDGGVPHLHNCDCTGTNFSGTNCETCSFPCDSGYEPNSECSVCILSDICVADNPCVNDGNCTLVSKPDNYTCSCANKFTSSSNCSECGLSCSPGYTNNTECDKCVLSDICEANIPCQNGGTCTLGSDPDQFTCSCINNFTSVSNCSDCSLSCEPGYLQDDVCKSCYLDDLCVADNPCQNGGTCEIVSKPVNFNCTCTNSFDPASNCTECPLKCDPGHDYDTACTDCYLTDICLAANPCLNGATCVSGDTPTQYTCQCANMYTGANCSDCPLTCSIGYEVDSVCSGCELDNKCLADTPCKNGGTCNLITKPDHYQCDCINLFDTETDCDVCLKTCPPGYSPDAVCSDECVLTSICAAITPCKNNGECVLGLTPDLYTCDCDKSFFTGTNCTDCNKVCPPGYTLDTSRCVCDLTDICVAETPCMNGATCSLVDGAPDRYQCACRNEFGDENCATCTLECNNGGKFDTDCKLCECRVGYTGDNCLQIDNCARSRQCSGRGTCINHETSFECVCGTGATGYYCDDCVDGYVILSRENNTCVLEADQSSGNQDFTWWYALIPAVAFLAFILVVIFLMVVFITVRGNASAAAAANRQLSATTPTGDIKIPLTYN